MRRLRSLVAVVLVLGPIGLYGSAAGAAAGGANNVVMATNTVDATSVANDRLQVAYDPADTVANQNIATATGTECFQCRTIAVAMQVVIVESVPSDFEPANAAVASNGSCTECQTFAFAYQYVVQPARVVSLDATTQQALANIRQQLDAIASDTSLSYDAMKTQLDAVFVQFVQTVNDGMQAVGGAPGGQTYETARAA